MMRPWPPALLVLLLLALAVAAALCLGHRIITPAAAWAALWHPDPFNADHVALRGIRLPRLWAGLVAGAALGMAGVVMQALTRNPLAEPGLAGVNAGAALAVVAGALLLGTGDDGVLTLLAFPGAAAAALAVLLLGGGGGPLRLALAGATLNALLLSLIAAIVLIRAEGLEVLRFWVTGSLAQAAARPLAAMTVVAGLAGLGALALAPALELLALGEAMARGLGTRTGRVKAAGLALIALLAGAAVSVAGPVAFLGLIVPHLARRLVGSGIRAQLLAALALGPALLLAADVAGRLVLAPAEVRAGVMVALVGGPVFILIARRLRPGAVA